MYNDHKEFEEWARTYTSPDAPLFARTVSWPTEHDLVGELHEHLPTHGPLGEYSKYAAKPPTQREIARESRARSSKWKKSWRQEIRRSHLAAGDFLLHWGEDDEFEELDKDDPTYPETTFDPKKVDNTLLPIHVPAECQDERDQCRRHINQYKNRARKVMRAPLTKLEKEIERLTEEVADCESWDNSKKRKEKKRMLKEKRKERRIANQHINEIRHSIYAELKKTHRKTVKGKRRTLRSASSTERGLATWLPRERRAWKTTLRDIYLSTRNITEKALAAERLRN